MFGHVEIHCISRNQTVDVFGDTRRERTVLFMRPPRPFWLRAVRVADHPAADENRAGSA